MGMDYRDRRSFEEMSIGNLRLVGKELKVNAPTSKKKDELIDAIMEKIESGAKPISELVPTEKKPKGRPPKPTFILKFEDSDASEEKEETENVQLTFGNSETESVENVTQTNEAPIVDSDFVFVKQSDADNRRNKMKPSINGYNDNSKRQNNNNNFSNNGYNNGGYNSNGIMNRRKRDYNNENFNSQMQNNNQNLEEDMPNVPLEPKEGVLEIMADGYGFLRARNYESGSNDAYVAVQKIKRYGLRKGDRVKAEAKPSGDARPGSVVNVLEVNGINAEELTRRPNFDNLTPIYPDVRYKLEIPNKTNDFAIRCIDMVAPIGKGQRAMIVSPPKAGKTTLLKKIAHSISVNYPEAYLIVLLIDERPEEVTDMQRSIDGEVVYSTFDEMPEHHTKAAELVLERAKRLVEIGKDVVILMDSLTRLARAYNLTISPTGRTLSGGIDPGALHSPKRFFGAARNIENGGSLTIIATALVDTGSRMDDVIYEEFKGTGNMEIHLDRRLSEKRIFPAIDLYRSGTRREELLLDQAELQGAWAMRKMLSGAGEGADATENLLNMLVKTKTNKEFIEQLNLQLISLKKQGYLV